MYYETQPEQQYHNSPEQGYIAPQSLHNMTNTDRRRSSELPSKPKIVPSNIQAVCTLAPGRTHQITQDIVPIPTPRSLMDGSYYATLNSNNYKDKHDVFTIVPRIPEHCGQPSLPSIVFCVNGKPGPYLHRFERIILDAPDSAVFDDYGWRRTSLVIDWPGVRTEKHYLNCTGESSFYTRQEVAREVARRIVSMISYSRKPNRANQIIESDNSQWDIRTVDIRDVRLLGLNYYNGAWVPVLAMDD